MASRFDTHSSHSGNLAMAILVFVVLGCMCPNSQRERSNVSAPSNSIATTSPTPTPSPITSATPAVTDLDTPEAQPRITKGEQLYKRIASRTGLPVMFGWRAKKMSLLVPTSDWSKMPKDDQVNLTYYAENLVREIRIDPAPYARRWAAYYKRTEQLESGGEYDGLYESSYIEQVGNLCYTCWDITIGTNKRDGFYDESSPVSGDTVQQFRAGIK